ncbi:ASCH domain-containing protein [Pseudoalteromonas phenolica]|uniref:ASCH domain-containing protein n=1 Tax=Pseudoalteromonas phenolica TaxID=161398 RepID=UPI00110BE6AB|nr:ASCH domain-containing protein [Pseudoalteromonas phenolica]TMO53209.1 hypothetical protein CWC21_20750 [Pseudoalteromonas phenolica]
MAAFLILKYTLINFMNSISDAELIISIKPHWVEKIFSGVKTVELRKTFCKKDIEGSNAIIYASAPVSAVVGVVKIKSVDVSDINGLWQTHKGSIGATKEQFFEYFNGKGSGVALTLVEPEKVNNIELDELRKGCRFNPPVSWRYIKDYELCFIKNYA